MRQGQIQRQALKQTQRLSQVQRQSLKVLSLTTYDLFDEIKMYSEINPALDISELDSKISLDESKSTLFSGEAENYNLDTTDTSPETLGSRTDKHDKYIQAQAKEITLEEHLLSQLAETRLKDEEIEIAEIIISALDKRGFLAMDVDVLFENMDYGDEQIERVLTILQYLDPIGTCTQNYTESLLVQANRRKNTPELVFTLISEHMEDVAAKNLDKIHKITKHSLEDIDEAIKIIKELNPYPGSLYNNKDTSIVSEAIISVKDGKINLKMQDKWNEAIKIDETFCETIKNEDVDNNVTKKLINEAKAFIDSLSQRSQTIYKVINYIITKQKDYFLLGKEFLIPMTQKEIAEELKYDESTISRAVKDKYITTNHGNINLSNFFSTTRIKSGEKDLSKQHILNEIKIIQENYTGEKKLSAQMVTDSLNKKGIEIARRTVSKYLSEIN